MKSYQLAHASLLLGKFLQCELNNIMNMLNKFHVGVKIQLLMENWQNCT